VTSNWRRINRAVRETLAGITLAEMAAPLFMAHPALAPRALRSEARAGS
jgi:hypothetical protein